MDLCDNCLFLEFYFMLYDYVGRLLKLIIFSMVWIMPVILSHKYGYFELRIDNFSPKISIELQEYHSQKLLVTDH